MRGRTRGKPGCRFAHPGYAALFWAVTAYNITDGTMVEAPQLMPSINGFNKVSTNSEAEPPRG